jgi:hypothetical protein
LEQPQKNGDNIQIHTHEITIANERRKDCFANEEQKRRQTQSWHIFPPQS